MRTALLATIVILAAISGSMFFHNIKGESRVPLSTVHQFNAWKVEHGKLYGTPAESSYRLSVFNEQVNEVSRLNTVYAENERKAGLPFSGYKHSINPTSDLSNEEFTAIYTGVNADLIEDEVDEPNMEMVESSETNLGAGYESRIRNQSRCGSCWAFATIVTIESMAFKTFKNQYNISQQDLVDCDSSNNGCSGGWPTKALNYIKANGVPLASRYPYTATKGACQSVSSRFKFGSHQTQAKQLKWTQATHDALASKNVHASFALYASGAFRQLYGRGSSLGSYNVKLSGECLSTTRINHAVNASSKFGTKANTVFVQNSWGDQWGFNGVQEIRPCGSEDLWGHPNYLMHADPTGV